MSTPHRAHFMAEAILRYGSAKIEAARSAPVDEDDEERLAARRLFFDRLEIVERLAKRETIYFEDLPGAEQSADRTRMPAVWGDDDPRAVSARAVAQALRITDEQVDSIAPGWRAGLRLMDEAMSKMGRPARPRRTADAGHCGRRGQAAAAWGLDALAPLRCLESAIRSGRAGHLVVMPDEALAIDR